MTRYKVEFRYRDVKIFRSHRENYGSRFLGFTNNLFDNHDFDFWVKDVNREEVTNGNDEDFYFSIGFISLAFEKKVRLSSKSSEDGTVEFTESGSGKTIVVDLEQIMAVHDVLES